MRAGMRARRSSALTGRGAKPSKTRARGSKQNRVHNIKPKKGESAWLVNAGRNARERIERPQGQRRQVLNDSSERTATKQVRRESREGESSQ